MYAPACGAAPKRGRPPFSNAAPRKRGTAPFSMIAESAGFPEVGDRPAADIPAARAQTSTPKTTRIGTRGPREVMESPRFVAPDVTPRTPGDLFPAKRGALPRLHDSGLLLSARRRSGSRRRPSAR